MVTDEQVRLLRQKMKENKTQEAAAAAGMRTARTWQRGPLPSQSRPERDWRTRPDPFTAVWDTEVIPLVRADSDGVLEATTVLKLEQQHPGQGGPEKLRTLQRRVRDFRALEGPERSVIFPQEHVPGGDTHSG